MQVLVMQVLRMQALVGQYSFSAIMSQFTTQVLQAVGPPYVPPLVLPYRPVSNMNAQAVL